MDSRWTTRDRHNLGWNSYWCKNCLELCNPVRQYYPDGLHSVLSLNTAHSTATDILPATTFLVWRLQVSDKNEEIRKLKTSRHANITIKYYYKYIKKLTMILKLENTSRSSHVQINHTWYCSTSQTPCCISCTCSVHFQWHTRPSLQMNTDSARSPTKATTASAVDVSVARRSRSVVFSCSREQLFSGKHCKKSRPAKNRLESSWWR